MKNSTASKVDKALINSMAWSDTGTREIAGKTYAVRTAMPNNVFWPIYKAAKEEYKDAGFHVGKDAGGKWVVEHLQVIDDLDARANPVVKLPHGEDWSGSGTMDVVMVPVEQLIENPLNTTMYDRAVSPAILESVEQHGVKVPLRALHSGKLLDGHQRLEAARSAGYKFVPVSYEDVEDGHEIEAILGYNSQRIKSLPDRLREYREYLKIEATKAQQRAGVRTDIGAQLPESQQEWGKSRDLAAKMVGLSGSTAERGLRVLEAIEKHSESEHAAEAMKRLLNRGVDPAHKYAYSIGWIDSAVKAKIPKKQQSKSNAQREESTPRGEWSHSEDNSQPSQTGWMTDDLIDDAVTCAADDEATDELRRTMEYLRPRLYEVAGTTPSAKAANNLRVLAKAVEALAKRYDELAEHHLQTPTDHENSKATFSKDSNPTP